MRRGSSASVLLLLVAVSAAAWSLTCDPECVMGDCEPYLGNLTCSCYGNWSGEDCSTFICDIENQCENNGTCTPNPHNRTEYLCSCPLPYFGNRCQYTAAGNSCDSEPCKNGSTCYDLAAGGFECHCTEDTWGVTCNRSRADVNTPDLCAPTSLSNICYGHGVCHWTDDPSMGYSHCVCEPGYRTTFRCEIFNNRDLCSPSPCANGGTCENLLAFNNSSREVEPYDYVCSCDGRHSGRNCTEEFDICRDHCGLGNCTPIYGGHYYSCACPPDRTGYDCENFVDPCQNFECHNGGTCQPDASQNPDGSYSSSEASCDCCPGYDGDHCEFNIGRNHTLCQPSPCQNGGSCRLTNSSYVCDCPEEYEGANCEYNNFCIDSPCKEENTERCENLPSGAICICRDGWGGSTCKDDIDECLALSNPCQNDGTCENSLGGFLCLCPPEYTGERCTEYVPQPVNCSSSQQCLNGGVCMEQDGGTMVCNCSDGFTGDLCERIACPHMECASLASNGRCDMECFTEACGYDGREGLCFSSVNVTDPWANCTRADFCRRRFENGQCDYECNSRECLFDAYECLPPEEECPAKLAEECFNSTDDGICREECNTAKCPYDFQDCNSEKFARDLLVVYVIDPTGQSSLDENTLAQRKFAEAISALTQTNAIIKDVNELSSKEAENMKIDLPEGGILYRVRFRLDTEYCTDQCIQSAEEAVKLLEAHFSHGNTQIGQYDYVRSSAESDEPESESSTTAPVAIAVTIVVVAVLGLFIVAGVLIGKKRIRAKTWYPGRSQAEADTPQEASPPAKKRKVSQSDSSAGALINSTENSSISASGTSSDYIEQGSKAAKMESGSGKGKVQWTDYQVAVEDSPRRKPPEMATVGQLGNDSRKWEFLHYASVRNPEVMRILMDDCKEEVNKGSFDPNTPGPGGYTPLMLVITQRDSHRDSGAAPSRSSSSSESSAETGEHNTLLSPTSKSSPGSDASNSSVTPGNATPPSPYDCSIDYLLKAKAKVDATNDYGRTALHIAAVCARGDYVKKLLTAGANPNIQDNWGQTPLHAAIGASAEGAFHILVSYPKTDINVKSDGGITPLMEAVKFLNLYMVKQLIKKNADISATDYEGRTAVHWAAMVNFVVALKLLIRQGPDTIKDAQDNKGQTALFLACREGSEDIVKHLLDVFANATLLDNLDRSPMHIACERQHTNIVEMLKSHGPYHYQLPPNGRVPVSHAPRVQLTAHPELAARQQHQRALLHASQYPHPGMMMEMQPMPMDQFGGYHRRPSHHSPEMHPSTHGQTFGDLGYPVPPVMSSPDMEIGIPNGGAPIPIQPYRSPSTPLFLSNTMISDAPSTSNPQHTPPQPYFTNPQLPLSTGQHPAPPITYSQHHSPPTQTVHPNHSPPSTSDVTLTYNQLTLVPDPSYPVFTSTNHFPMNQSEQMMVNELITSMAEDSTPQPSSNPLVTTPITAENTRPLQHLNEPNLPAYPTSDLYSTAAQPPQHQQICSPPQPHSTTSVNSNRSPSTLYPSPPNSDTLQHSEQNALAMGYSHGASPPSLTPSPETRDDLVRPNIATIEGLVQQHDYPNPYNNCGVDSYNYCGGIRFAQDSYNSETTV